MEKQQQKNKKSTIETPIVKPPPNKKTRQTNQLKFMSTLLRLLVIHDDAWPFSRPINPKEIRIPNYYEIVKTPMDFLTIRRRLRNSFYWSAKEVISDVNLVFKNAYKISEPNQLFYQYADNLKDYFLKLVEEMPLQESEISNMNENTNGDVVKTPQNKPKKILKRRESLPTKMTERKVRFVIDKDETEDKHVVVDEKSLCDLEERSNPTEFVVNLKERLGNLRNSLKKFHETFTEEIKGLKSMVSGDGINGSVSSGNPSGPQMNGICKKTTEKVKSKHAMAGPLSRKIPKLIERVKKLSEAQQNEVFFSIKELEPWIENSESGKFKTDLEAMKASTILNILELLDRFKK